MTHCPKGSSMFFLSHSLPILFMSEAWKQVLGMALSNLGNGLSYQLWGGLCCFLANGYPESSYSFHCGHHCCEISTYVNVTGQEGMNAS